MFPPQNSFSGGNTPGRFEDFHSCNIFLYVIFSGLVTGCLSLYVSYVYCNEETLFFGCKKNNEAINKKKKIFNK